MTPPDDQSAEQTTPAPEAELTGVGDAAPPAKAARPVKEAEPKEAPRIAPPAGSINEALAAAVSGVQIKAAYSVPSTVGESVCVEVSRDDVPAVLTACRDDARLDLTYLRCLSGVDWQDEGLEVVYHLYSMEKKHGLTVKTRVTYDDGMAPAQQDGSNAQPWRLAASIKPATGMLMPRS